MFPLQDSIPARFPPVMMWSLVVLNSVLFLLELSLPPKTLEWIVYLFGIVPARYTHPEWATVVGFPLDDYWPFLTSMFLHGGWMHIIGNMWFLWLFGDNVEDRMGPLRFLLFYLACGVIAAVIHVLVNPDSTIPTIGASGAIAGVLGAYFMMFPHARVIAVVPILFYPLFFTVPAAVFLFVWFLMQFLSGTTSMLGGQQVGGVAWWAHIGGFVAGMFLYRLFLSPARNRPWHPDELGPAEAWGRKILDDINRHTRR